MNWPNSEGRRLVDRVHQEGNLVEVEYVPVHPSKKEKQQMSLFEKFITEGSKTADELAKEGPMMDGGVMTQQCNMQAVFTVWCRNGNRVKHSNPSQKRSGRLWTHGGQEAPHGMGCGCEQIPLHEVEEKENCQGNSRVHGGWERIPN